MTKLLKIINQYFLEIAQGDFKLTDEQILLEKDPEIQGILFGLLYLNEELELRNQVAEETRRVAENYKNALNSSAIVSYTDLKGNIIYVNDLFCEISQYSRDELIGQNQSIVNSNLHPKEFWKDLWKTIGNGNIWKGNIRNKKKDGSFYWVFTTIVPFINNNKVQKYLSMRYEITALVEAEEEIKSKTLQSLHEKNVMLKEIHHRVKNNMQVVTSLMSLQASKIEDEHLKEVFVKSQYRINSMALVHELLYQADNLSQINISDYIKKLANSIAMSFHGNNEEVKLKMSIPEIHLNMDTAIPLGIIVTEILTNSYKYAFNDITSSIISITLSQNQDSTLLLTIEDNGIGFDREKVCLEKNTLGLSLIDSLCQQLEGEYYLNTENGTSYKISFNEML
ncbi:PAS domain S-box protein [Paracrocinitomix mangrovi]|uniref:sensor histidine kinase n=1 Tax=Paracrocinitomix mangrovi TaxID=2862509 RepID=UPI001C8E19F9|nr:histidine kinase dimerization/phosphoacceptor domain -containing protein [Paracrocinitomix mangrovi]UKN01996.1 PAS domain S-box protein [Paracrocinitomix mangrovi]